LEDRSWQAIARPNREAQCLGINARLVDDDALVILLLNDVLSDTGLIDIARPILAGVLNP
jgi:hypothetical protein